jgi:hypothetical protein
VGRARADRILYGERHSPSLSHVIGDLVGESVAGISGGFPGWLGTATAETVVQTVSRLQPKALMLKPVQRFVIL